MAVGDNWYCKNKTNDQPTIPQSFRIASAKSFLIGSTPIPADLGKYAHGGQNYPVEI